MEILGYQMEIIDQLPSDTTSQFNGLGNPFHFQEPQPGEKLLFVECGGGSDLLYGRFLVGEEGFGIGLDFSQALVAETEEAIRTSGMSWLEVRIGTLLNLSFKESQFNRVVFNWSFFLFLRKKELLEKCYRVLSWGD